MDIRDSFSSSIYADQMHLAERELSAFIRAVKELFGPDQARLSAEDWLEESELLDSPPRSLKSRDERKFDDAVRRSVYLPAEPRPQS